MISNLYERGAVRRRSSLLAAAYRGSSSGRRSPTHDPLTGLANSYHGRYLRRRVQGSGVGPA